MSVDNIAKIRELFPDFSEEQLINVNTYGRKANRAHYILQINSELYPYNGQRYVLIGDWFYIVAAYARKNNSTYSLHITHTLHLKNIDVKTN